MTGLELQRPHADCSRCAHRLSWECVDCDRNRGGTSDRFELSDGEQSPTSDEREIDRLRLEVARLQRVIVNSASSLDGLLDDAAALGYQAHPRLVDALRWLARDLRAGTAKPGAKP